MSEEQTRRGLMAGLFGRLPGAGRLARASSGQTAAPAPRPRGWITAGSLADFPPGRRVVIDGGLHAVLSDGYGLRVVQNGDSMGPDGRSRPMRLTSTGRVMFDADAWWPEFTCLSPMTGERRALPEE